MLKQIFVLIILSAIVVLSMTYVQQGVQVLINSHHWIAELLTEVFSSGKTGSLAKGLIALLSIPILAGLIPALIYWVIKRNWFPYFMETVWAVWLIQTGALVIMYQA